jgi:transposase
MALWAGAWQNGAGRRPGMHISERVAGDLKELRERARRERVAEQKDRLMAVVLALEGWETQEIQESTARSRGFVQRWVYAYRDGGLGALRDKPRGGSVAKIHGENLQKFKARLDAGPTKEDKVCRLRGVDLRRIAKEELKTEVSLSAVYRTLERLEYSYLAPRPRHEQQDLEAQKRFKEQSAPLL